MFKFFNIILFFIFTICILPTNNNNTGGKKHCYIYSFDIDDNNHEKLIQSCDDFSFKKNTNENYLLYSSIFKDIKPKNDSYDSDSSDDSCDNNEDNKNDIKSIIILKSKKNEVIINLFKDDNFYKNIKEYIDEVKEQMDKYFNIKYFSDKDIETINEKNYKKIKIGKIKSIRTTDFDFKYDSKKEPKKNLLKTIKVLIESETKDNYDHKIILENYINTIMKNKTLKNDFDISYEIVGNTIELKFKIKEDKSNEILSKYFKKIYTAKFYIPENMIRYEKQINEDDFKKVQKLKLIFYEKMDLSDMSREIEKKVKEILTDDKEESYSISIFSEDGNELETGEILPNGNILFYVKEFLIDKQEKEQEDKYKKSVDDITIEINNAIECNKENKDIDAVFTTFNDYIKKIKKLQENINFVTNKIYNKLDKLEKKINDFLKLKDIENLKSVIINELNEFNNALKSANESTIMDIASKYFFYDSLNNIKYIDIEVKKINFEAYLRYFASKCKKEKIKHEYYEYEKLAEEMKDCQIKDTIFKTIENKRRELSYKITILGNNLTLDGRFPELKDKFNKLIEEPPFNNPFRNISYKELFKKLILIVDNVDDNSDRKPIFTITNNGIDFTYSDEIMEKNSIVNINFLYTVKRNDFNNFEKRMYKIKLQEGSKKEESKIDEIPKKETKEQVISKKESKKEKPKKETVITKPREKESKEEVTKKEVISKKESKEEVTKKETVITKPREEESKKLIPKPKENTNCCCGGCNKCCRNRSLQKT